MKKDIVKTIIFFRLWGFRKTLFKILGRKRFNFLSLPKGGDRSIAVIGCGQFAFSTLGSTIIFTKGNIFKRAFDISKNALISFENFYSIKQKTTSIDEIINDSEIKIVYICSSHSTHTEYAKRIINSGKNVHIEKPIAVEKSQLDSLCKVIDSHPDIKITTGFNRPFSPFIKRIKNLYCNTYNFNKNPIIANLFVACHKLPKDHWYFKSEEGSRISGNYSHWIDLVIHILRWSKYNSILDISIFPSNILDLDQNMMIVIKSTNFDMFTMNFTSLMEPVLGVTENIYIQSNNFTTNINNFNFQSIDFGNSYKVYKTRKKNCGHDESILQQFNSVDYKIRLKEVICSSSLTIAINNSIKNNQLNLSFDMSTFFD